MRLNITAARSVAVLLFSAALPVSAQAQVTENTGVSKATPSLPLKVSVDVTAPRPVYTPEPEYSEEARAAGHQGTCVLWLIVDTDGKARNIRVARSLGMGLDEEAIEAVRRWTFEPARKNGRPVAFQINVEVSFRLSRNGLTNVLSPEQLDKVSEAQARARALAQSQIHRISEGRAPRSCKPSSSDSRQRSGPVVTIAELRFEGDLSIGTADRGQISASISRQPHFGDRDEVTSQVLERVRAAWQERGYLKVEVRGDAKMLSNSPVDERVAVTVHVDEGQQYRLERITFKNNSVVSKAEALRNLFPIRDGDVFNRNLIVEGLDKLRNAYAELGYINFISVPNTQIDEGSQTISLDIGCDEGKQFFVSRINFMGLDESVFQNVREDLFVKPGDVYNRRLVKLFLDEHASLLQADESSEPRFDCDWMNEPPQLRLHTISGAAMSSKCFLAVFWIAVVISPLHSRPGSERR